MSFLLAAFVAAAPTGSVSSCALHAASGLTVEASSLKDSTVAVEQLSVGNGEPLTVAFRSIDGKLRRPIAIGFCRAALGPRPTSPSSDQTCTLVVANGRTARVSYWPFDGDRAAFESPGGWPWAQKAGARRGKVTVDRRKVRITALSGPHKLRGAEYFYYDGNKAANLVLLTQLGEAPDLRQPAAILCGYDQTNRARVTQ